MIPGVAMIATEGASSGGGGGGGGGVTVEIVPSSSTTSDETDSGYNTHTVSVSGGTASSYAWVATDGGSINGATNGASASLWADVNQLNYTYRCDVVVDGDTYSPTCTRRHNNLS